MAQATLPSQWKTLTFATNVIEGLIEDHRLSFGQIPLMRFLNEVMIKKCQVFQPNTNRFLLEGQTIEII
ncbi:Protein of unknown function [Gryllus bimaculatus]|nr:Protein of unknown function [Gryllus bimaculatus]